MLTDINDKRTVYLLGLLWADGSFSFKGSGRIGIACVNEDSEPIKRICAAHGLVHWKTKQSMRRGKPWGRLQFVMSLRMDQAYTQLRQWGFDTKTSPSLLLSCIPPNLRHYWWRGYLDGDGCIYIGKRKVELTFWSTQDQEWRFVEDLFTQLGIDGLRTTRYKRKQGAHCSSSIASYNQTAIQRFLTYVYEGDDVNELGYIRKHTKYLELLARVQYNLTRRAPRTSIYPHVSRRGPNHRWQAFIWRFNAHLGLYDTEEEAHHAVQEYLKKHAKPKSREHEYSFKR